LSDLWSHNGQKLKHKGARLAELVTTLQVRVCLYTEDNDRQNRQIPKKNNLKIITAAFNKRSIFLNVNLSRPE